MRYITILFILLFTCFTADAQRFKGNTYFPVKAQLPVKPKPVSVPQVGDVMQGGVVFYVDQANHKAYVVAKEDIRNGKYSWGCYGTGINGADGTAIGTGQQNTLDLLYYCSQMHIAARKCAYYSISVDGKTYDDWFLPSKDELAEIYDQKSILDRTEGFVPFLPYGYWSSTESSNYSVWLRNFSDGHFHVSRKNKTYFHIRPIRSFTYYASGCTNSAACNSIGTLGNTKETDYTTIFRFSEDFVGELQGVYGNEFDALKDTPGMNREVYIEDKVQGHMKQMFENKKTEIMKQFDE